MDNDYDVSDSNVSDIREIMSTGSDPNAPSIHNNLLFLQYGDDSNNIKTYSLDFKESSNNDNWRLLIGNY